MRRTRIFAALLATIAVCGTAQAARAAELLGHGSAPDVAVDADGTAHLVWLAVAESITAIQYCRIPPSESRCSTKEALVLRFGVPAAAGPPRVLLAGRRIVVMAGTSGSPPEDGLDGERRTVLWESVDGGESFGPAFTVGTLRPADAVLTGDGSRVITIEPHHSGRWVQLQSAPSTPAQTPAQDVATMEAEHYLPQHFALGVGDSGPVAVWDGSFTQHFAGDANVTENWLAPSPHGRIERPRR